MSKITFCVWCGEYHIQFGPCAGETIDPPSLSRTSSHAAVQPQTPPLTQPELPGHAAAATSAATTTHTVREQPATEKQIPATAGQWARPANHPDLLGPRANAMSAATTTGSATDQPASEQQVELKAGPSQSRPLKRKEAPGDLDDSSGDHDRPTRRRRIRARHSAGRKQRRVRRQEERAVREEEQTVQEGEKDWLREEQEGIEEGEKALQSLADPPSIVEARLARGMAAWKARAERLEAEKAGVEGA